MFDAREYQRRYRKEHREEWLEYQRRYRKEHKEEMNQYYKRYYQRHKEDIKYYQRERYRQKCQKEYAEKTRDNVKVRRTNPKCNEDCFNCIYEDCIL